MSLRLARATAWLAAGVLGLCLTGDVCVVAAQDVYRPLRAIERDPSRRDRVDRRSIERARNEERARTRERTALNIDWREPDLSNRDKGNRYRDFVASELRDRGFSVDTEVNIRTESGVYRADIVATFVDGPVRRVVIVETKATEQQGMDNFRGERGARQRQRLGEIASDRARRPHVDGETVKPVGDLLQGEQDTIRPKRASIARFEISSRRRRPIESGIRNGDEIPRGAVRVITPATYERILESITPHPEGGLVQ